MAKIMVDNKQVELNGERNLLEVIRKAGINLLLTSKGAQ